MNPYRQLRLERGLRVREMAYALRVNASSIQALETGAPPVPYSTVEHALAELLGVDRVKALRIDYIQWRENQGEATRKKLLSSN